MKSRGIWRSGGMMAVLGALIGLREAGARLSVLAEQAASFAGGPTPRVLDWIDGTTRAQRLLAALDGWMVLGIVVLAVALALRLARLLNPSGTLLAPGATVPADLRARLHAPLAQPLVRRSVGAALLSAYLLGGGRYIIDGLFLTSSPSTWGLSGLIVLWRARPWLGLGAAFLLGGAALWLLWGEWGVVTPQQARSSSRSGTLVRGLIAGAAAFPVLVPLSLWGRGQLDGVLAAVGLADPAPWRLCLWGMALGLPLGFFALGLLGHALARPVTVPASLIRVPALFLALLAAGEAYFSVAVIAGRYDRGRDLAALVGSARGSSSSRTYLIFPPAPIPGPLPGFVPDMSIEGIDAGHDSPRRTWEYLRRREFESAAVGEAFVHLHDCASLQWDSAESLRVDLANLERNPQPIFGHLLLEKLFTCGPSPENRALLGQAADPARFRPDPAWLRTLGLLHVRFGERAAAAQLLRRAGMAPAEVREALGRQPSLTSGAVAGRIVVDGQPGSGLTAGLVAAGQWRGLVGRPRPFELRWVAAAAPVDAGGGFRLSNLGEGPYVLIVMGDPQRLPLRPPGARADASPGLLHLDGRHPTRDLGTIRIVTHAAPAAPPAESS